jgi:hypothetical protein
VLPAGFSGLGINSNSVFPADLTVSSPRHGLREGLKNPAKSLK